MNKQTVAKSINCRSGKQGWQVVSNTSRSVFSGWIFYFIFSNELKAGEDKRSRCLSVSDFFLSVMPQSISLGQSFRVTSDNFFPSRPKFILRHEPCAMVFEYNNENEKETALPVLSRIVSSSHSVFHFTFLRLFPRGIVSSSVFLSHFMVYFFQFYSVTFFPCQFS